DAGTNSTNLSVTKDAANQEVRKNESSLRYILLPTWAYDALLESTSSKPYKESRSQVPEGSRNPNSTASTFNPLAEQMETLTVESPIPTVSSLFCLYSCFLSQVEPKKVSDALQEPSWVEAMQEELLQFKIHKV
nr:putative ribonuclease H-like domain-containing protein [Tanacetum cinerariifolium]